MAQQNLRNRVSWSGLFDDADDADGLVTHTGATFYSYDIHGNVDTLLQDINQGVMKSSGNRFKKMVYRYDLISGKVEQVAYEPGNRDGFYHRYFYDAENRLTDVETSSDSIYWEKEAYYSYYKHGPLSRTVLGQQQVQGIDYVYTLQGWLKAINPSSPSASSGSGCPEGFAPATLTVDDRSPGDPDEYIATNTINLGEGFENGGTDDYFDAVIDGSQAPCNATGDYNTTDGTTNSAVAKDAYNVVLNYYKDGQYADYKGIASPSPSFTIAGTLGSNSKPLYNGNISSMAVNIGKLNSPMVYGYQYDQLNRLVNMDAFTSSDANWGTLTATNDYKEQISYDPNGKILDFARWGKNRQLDDAHYHYYANTNQLKYISDGFGKVTDDVKDQGTTNYGWNEIGEMTSDGDRGLTDATWTVYGKIQSQALSNDHTINYTYDASGNRISKTVSGTGGYTEWYVRDASGNVMSTYKTDVTVNSGHLMQTEVNLYGSSRLGTYKPNIDVIATPDNTVTLVDGSRAYAYNFTRGSKFFELTDHRSNNLATASDRKLQHTTDNAIVDYYLSDVVTAQDYSSFGALLDSRQYGNTPRFTYNGKQLDKELGWQEYGMREYLGGSVPVFASVDPLTGEYPELTPYQYASDRPIDGIDRDGLEHTEAGMTKFGPRESTSVKLYPVNAKELIRRSDELAARTNYLHQWIVAPDIIGNARIGPRYIVQENIAVSRKDYYDAVGDNITGGPIGAGFYWFGGEDASFYGAAGDQMTQSFGGIDKEGYLSKPKNPIVEPEATKTEMLNNPKRKATSPTIRQKQATSKASQALVAARIDSQLQPDEIRVNSPRFYIGDGSNKKLFAVPDFAIYNTKTNQFVKIIDAKNGGGDFTDNQDLLNTQGGVFYGSSRAKDVKSQAIRPGLVYKETTNLSYGPNVQYKGN